MSSHNITHLSSVDCANDVGDKLPGTSNKLAVSGGITVTTGCLHCREDLQLLKRSVSPSGRE